jgi:uncharacterized membrane protein
MGLPETGTAAVGRSGPERVKAFSDAVFAIIITLLVLDLRVPEYEPGELWAALAARWPAYLAFTVSFVYVGALWLNHHALFRHIAHVDLGLQWLNLALLLGTVVIPFPTSVLATTFDADTADVQDQRVAVLVYSLVAMVMSLTWGGVWLYLSGRPGLLVETTEPGWIRAQLPRPITGIVLFGVGGLAGWFISPVIGLLCIVAMIVYHAVTSEGVRRRR